jgi:putative transposase
MARCWLADRVLLKIVYLLVRRLLGLAVLVFRKDLANDAELLVLRHENAVLRRHVGRIRYEPADRIWFAALARFLPRRRWTGIFPITPATLLARHRRLAGRKYDTSGHRGARALRGANSCTPRPPESSPSTSCTWTPCC